ncbi:DUF916 and DUF3324 domain-containing protein [Candidatus Enterococcus mansonii]|uniref:Uncharacterized protein n=1 Tax=Candidatus Enterococcus mansonii TaxID=1834181 RepID=A0A242CDF9_9ENTE|nr:DUF916 and DUF3324 domain-containing protein [Enterococcus sp. 4G2_DIV0659]OTO08158.1 hypothetical protein A5880_002428 [Enterococcus sp. 4G2_DIV0659]
MKQRLVYFSLFLILIMWMFPSAPIYAQDSDSAGGVAGFTYESIKPDNQRSEEGYFDLRMSPSQKQTVQVRIMNPADKEIELTVKLNGVKTNANGVLEYGPNLIENDESLKFDFTDIVKAPETIKIPAKGETRLDIDISMPETSFDGLIAGGIQLQKKDTETQNKTKGAGIINKYAYLLGMVLSETDVVVEPELKFNKVYPELNNYRNTFFVNFSNIKANYLENMTTDVQIMGEKSDKVLYETKKTGMRMGPNTKINFPVSMDGDKVVPGNYRAHILVTSGAKKWEWNETFKITDEEADKLNQEDVNMLETQTVNWKFVGILVGSILVGSLLLFFVIRFIVSKKKKSSKKKQVPRKHKER